MSVRKLQNTGTEAIKKMRLDKLRNGIPFMINSKELPSNQAYLEYPDGGIVLVMLAKGSRHFTPVRSLSSSEIAIVRNKYLPA
jgi:hypothetical protein